jgi:hypothetical protein
MLDEEILNLYKFLSNRANSHTDINQEVNQYSTNNNNTNYRRIDNVKIKAKNFKYIRKSRITSKGLGLVGW